METNIRSTFIHRAVLALCPTTPSSLGWRYLEEWAYGMRERFDIFVGRQMTARFVLEVSFLRDNSSTTSSAPVGYKFHAPYWASLDDCCSRWGQDAAHLSFSFRSILRIPRCNVIEAQPSGPNHWSWAQTHFQSAHALFLRSSLNILRLWSGDCTVSSTKRNIRTVFTSSVDQRWHFRQRRERAAQTAALLTIEGMPIMSVLQRIPLQKCCSPAVCTLKDFVLARLCIQFG